VRAASAVVDGTGRTRRVHAVARRPARRGAGDPQSSYDDARPWGESVHSALLRYSSSTAGHAAP